MSLIDSSSSELNTNKPSLFEFSQAITAWDSDNRASNNPILVVPEAIVAVSAGWTVGLKVAPISWRKGNHCWSPMGCLGTFHERASMTVNLAGNVLKTSRGGVNYDSMLDEVSRQDSSSGMNVGFANVKDYRNPNQPLTRATLGFSQATRPGMSTGYQTWSRE
ncbi:hypothetical protein NE237_005607 [Protea cynaroides]|uniref:Uncharacterized protein n=1 Tax=Protea cynaroides TaxID=273540 RepID=A0A9Q0JTH6_9MAGN|nr:hypothetical protein NE237_005607 [Protea cynaroides]